MSSADSFPIKPHLEALAAAEKAQVTIERVDLAGNARQVARLAARRARAAKVWIDGLVGAGINGKLREPLSQVVAELPGFLYRILVSFYGLLLIFPLVFSQMMVAFLGYVWGQMSL